MREPRAPSGLSGTLAFSCIDALALRIVAEESEEGQAGLKLVRLQKWRIKAALAGHP